MSCPFFFLRSFLCAILLHSSIEESSVVESGEFSGTRSAERNGGVRVHAETVGKKRKEFRGKQRFVFKAKLSHALVTSFYSRLQCADNCRHAEWYRAKNKCFSFPDSDDNTLIGNEKFIDSAKTEQFLSIRARGVCCVFLSTNRIRSRLSTFSTQSSSLTSLDVNHYSLHV